MHTRTMCVRVGKGIRINPYTYTHTYTGMCICTSPCTHARPLENMRRPGLKVSARPPVPCPHTHACVTAAHGGKRTPSPKPTPTPIREHARTHVGVRGGQDARPDPRVHLQLHTCLCRVKGARHPRVCTAPPPQGVVSPRGEGHCDVSAGVGSPLPPAARGSPTAPWGGYAPLTQSTRLWQSCRAPGPGSMAAPRPRNDARRRDKPPPPPAPLDGCAARPISSRHGEAGPCARLPGVRPSGAPCRARAPVRAPGGRRGLRGQSPAPRSGPGWSRAAPVPPGSTPAFLKQVGKGDAHLALVLCTSL